MEEQTVQVKVSLIITTYNWPEALKKVLDSVILQTILPQEVIIADDGSDKRTYELIEQYKNLLPCPLIHSWQEDKGFRAAKSRNKAIQYSNSEYIIFVDGDTIINKHFVHDHIYAAEIGTFIHGKRSYINELESQRLLSSNLAPSVWMQGLEHRDQSIRLPFSIRFINEAKKDSINRGMGGNCSFWKQDIVDVNGFNNDFEGWGPEDTEFCQRLLNKGLKCKRLRFKATCFHIHHELRSKKMLAENQKIYQNTVSNQLTRCKNGLEQSK